MRTLFFLLSLFVFQCCHAGILESEVVFDNRLGSAVLFQPEKSQPVKGGVIVIHEWWGMNAHARERAARLAEAGYAAIAVDMYGHGKVAAHPQDAKAFMTAALAEPDRMQARFDAAHQVLQSLAGVDASRVFAIGFCFGGSVVLEQARKGAALAGVASFHGGLSTQNPAQKGQVKARVLVATGGADPMIPPEQVGAFVTEMSAAAVDFELLSFPGVLHGFTNSGADALGEQFGLPLAYNAEADQRSWEALMRFLDLGSE
ncbi:MAG: dienelactone hydrolase family protein [Pseudomonadales bacterium]|nr:dienelactone hydrolase family protein [Pseudomonadales bacterium]